MSEDAPSEGTYDLTRELNYLDPEKVRLAFDAFGDLALEMDGEVRHRVTAYRVFPISSRSQFILFRDADGNELGLLQDARTLDRASRQALREELEHAYFTPKITAVHSIEEAYHIPRWDVETDRGPRVFDLRSTRDMRDLGNGRLLIRDADGNHYEIPDYRALDPASQSIVESKL